MYQTVLGKITRKRCIRYNTNKLLHVSDYINASFFKLLSLRINGGINIVRISCSQVDTYCVNSAIDTTVCLYYGIPLLNTILNGKKNIVIKSIEREREAGQRGERGDKEREWDERRREASERGKICYKILNLAMLDNILKLQLCEVDIVVILARLYSFPSIF